MASYRNFPIPKPIATIVIRLWKLLWRRIWSTAASSTWVLSNPYAFNGTKAACRVTLSCTWALHRCVRRSLWLSLAKFVGPQTNFRVSKQLLGQKYYILTTDTTSSWSVSKVPTSSLELRQMLPRKTQTKHFVILRLGMLTSRPGSWGMHQKVMDHLTVRNSSRTMSLESTLTS